MMKKLVFSALTFLLAFCLSPIVKGQTLPITGPDTLCAGDYGTYSTPVAPWVRYEWTVTLPGNISGPNNNPSVLIVWGSTGVGTVKVREIDTLGHAIDSGYLTVYVAPIPNPYITANITFGCQTLVITTTSVSATRTDTISNFDDSSGCVKVCEGSVITYTGHGPLGSRYGWSVVGGSILAAGMDTCSVLWGAAGSGSITVFDTSAYGCVGSKTVCIDIIEKPHAAFFAMPDRTSTSIHICRNGSIIFVDTSSSSGSPILSWFWNFGDGGAFTSGSSIP
jgi:hypothetical protein